MRNATHICIQILVYIHAITLHTHVEGIDTEKLIILSITHLLCTSKDCELFIRSYSVPNQHVVNGKISTEINLIFNNHLLVRLCTTSVTSVGSNRHDWLHLSTSCYNATNRNKLANMFRFYISNRFCLLVAKMFEMNFTEKKY